MRADIDIVTDDCRSTMVGANIQELRDIDIVANYSSAIDYHANIVAYIKAIAYFR